MQIFLPFGCVREFRSIFSSLKPSAQCVDDQSHLHQQESRATESSTDITYADKWNASQSNASNKSLIDNLEPTSFRCTQKTFLFSIVFRRHIWRPIERQPKTWQTCDAESVWRHCSQFRGKRNAPCQSDVRTSARVCPKCCHRTHRLQVVGKLIESSYLKQRMGVKLVEKLENRFWVQCGGTDDHMLLSAAEVNLKVLSHLLSFAVRVDQLLKLSRQNDDRYANHDHDKHLRDHVVRPIIAIAHGGKGDNHKVKTFQQIHSRSAHTLKVFEPANTETKTLICIRY